MIKKRLTPKLIILFLAATLFYTALSAQGQPYLGQTLPGTQPERFAPGIFTEEFHAPPIFSPDGTEVYWSLMDPQYPHLLFMVLDNGTWSDPAPAPFCIGDYTDSPFITSDGTKLFFLSMNQPAYDENIYIVQKQDGEWGTPQILGSEVNQFNPHWQASVSDNRNLYYGGQSSNYTSNIYFSEFVSSNYTEAVKLGSAVNTENGSEGSPFIAADESYMIFDRVSSGRYDADLFISHKQQNGTWSEAVSMSELNTNSHELYANVSPDGRFIMFLSGRAEGKLLPFWVDAQIINNYITGINDKTPAEKPASYQLYQNYPNPFNSDTRIEYQVSRTSNIELIIYSLSGQKVKTLVKRQQTPGRKSVSWDGRNDSGCIVNSGIYIFRLEAGGHSICRRMAFLK